MHEPRPMCEGTIGEKRVEARETKKNGHGGEGNNLDIVEIW